MRHFFITILISVLSTISVYSQEWVTTWATAQQIVEPHNNPPIPLEGQTLRQIVQVSIGGKQMRLRLSNRFSKEDLEIRSVEVAQALSGGVSSDINSSTSRQLTFNGKSDVIIKAGEETYSDLCFFDLTPRMNVAITIQYGKAPANIITGHPGSRTTSYFIGTDSTTQHWYTIESIDVVPEVKNTRAVAVMGNSITDGRGSTTDGQNRWTDVFSKCLLANKSTSNVSVLNFGLGGNCVVRGGLGPTAKDRYKHDLFGMSGVKYIILFEGVNDLGWARDGIATAKQIIDVYKTIIDEAHAKGIKVYVGTVMPFKNNSYYTADHENGRQYLNKWIRSAKEIDGCIDFDAVMRSANDPEALNPIYLFENDWLHPNALGYRTMGESVKLKLFKK